MHVSYNAYNAPQTPDAIEDFLVEPNSVLVSPFTLTATAQRLQLPDRALGLFIGCSETFRISQSSDLDSYEIRYGDGIYNHPASKNDVYVRDDGTNGTMTFGVLIPGKPRTKRVYDVFTDANDTALGSHTQTVGSGWTVATGAFTIQTNKASSTTLSGGQAIAYTDAGSGCTKYTVGCTIDPGSSAGTAGLLVRYVDSDDWTLVRANHTTSVLSITESVAGVLTIVNSEIYTPSVAGESYTLVVTVEGHRILATVGTTTCTAHTTRNNISTKVGLYGTHASDTFDSFLLVSAMPS